MPGAYETSAIRRGNVSNGALIPSSSPQMGTPSTNYGSDFLNTSFGPMLQPLPSPAKSPVKPVAVVTPALAKQDLATKNNALAATEQAMAAQAMFNAQNLNQPKTATLPNGQTVQIDAKGNIIAPQGGEGGAKTQTGAAGAQQGGPTAESATTKQEILNLLRDGEVALTYDQVKEIAGLDFTGFQQQPDGTFKADISAKNRILEANPSAQTGDERIAYATNARAELDKKADTAYQEYIDTVNQIRNGTMPLTADENAQVTALQQAFEQLKQIQITANKNYEGAITQLGIRSGRSRYAPEIESGNIKEAVDQGIARIAEIDAKAAVAVSELKQAIADKNFKLIDSLYGKTQEYLADRRTSINDIFKEVNEEIARQKSQMEARKMAFDLETTQIDNIAQAAFTELLQQDNTLNLDGLEEIADSYGVDVNALYNAVLKEKDEHDKLLRDESKFELDQQATRANIEQSRASTAASYANIEKTKAETAKIAAETAADQQAAAALDASSTLSAQPAYKGLGVKQKQQADSLNNLVNEITQYRDMFDKSVSSTGGSLIGSDAAVLSSKLNSIIFAAAQAEGTGALQAADREVIERIIPNPTTAGGAFTAAVRGGREGQKKQLADQIAKYEQRLRNYGLEPVVNKAPASAAASTAAPTVVVAPDGTEVEITD